MVPFPDPNFGRDVFLSGYFPEDNCQAIREVMAGQQPFVLSAPGINAPMPSPLTTPEQSIQYYRSKDLSIEQGTIRFKPIIFVGS